MCDVVKRHGSGLSEADAASVMRRELADVCAQVLRDAGVYKQDAAGRAGLYRFPEHGGASIGSDAAC